MTVFHTVYIHAAADSSSWVTPLLPSTPFASLWICLLWSIVLRRILKRHIKYFKMSSNVLQSWCLKTSFVGQSCQGRSKNSKTVIVAPLHKLNGDSCFQSQTAAKQQWEHSRPRQESGTKYHTATGISREPTPPQEIAHGS